MLDNDRLDNGRLFNSEVKSAPDFIFFDDYKIDEFIHGHTCYEDHSVNNYVINDTKIVYTRDMLLQIKTDSKLGLTHLSDRVSLAVYKRRVKIDRTSCFHLCVTGQS